MSISRLKVQKLRDQSESSSVFLRGLYALGTEWVRSRYRARGFSRGRGVKIALKGPRNLFRGVISLRKNFDFFCPRAPYLLRISTRSRDYNPGP